MSEEKKTRNVPKPERKTAIVMKKARRPKAKKSKKMVIPKLETDNDEMWFQALFLTILVCMVGALIVLLIIDEDARKGFLITGILFTLFITLTYLIKKLIIEKLNRWTRN